MKWLVLFVALAALVFAEGDDVLVLTSENFDETIEANPIILVEFFAPWCGHCKRLAPEYAKAATELKAVNLPIASVDADTDENRPLAKRFDIRGFPTLKLFRNGEPTDYKGERTAEGIVSYMKKQALPSVSSLNSAEEVTTFSTSDKVVVIGFFASEDSEEYKAFAATAESLRDSFSFGSVVGNSDLDKEFEAPSPSVVVFKKGDDEKAVTSGDWENLAAWIKANSVPLIDEIGPNNYRSYAEAGLPLGYLFVDFSKEGQLEEYLKVVRPIAENTKGKLNWVYIDWSKYARHAEGLGLSGKTVPSVAIDDMTTGKHFAFDETKEITAEGVSPWVDQFLAGELEPTIKSEEIPEDNSGPVTILVAKNFDEIVLDETKDVLVEFYAPWCGHCKQLAPTYEELGAAFSDVDSVVIAKIDASANDIDSSYGVRGFPTLKFFPANNKKAPTDYNGDRSLDDLKQFVKNNAHIQIDSEDAEDGAKDEL